MNALLAVALGGAIGASARFSAGLAAGRWTDAPGLYGTLFVNIIGSACMGALMAWLLSRPQNDMTNILFLLLGVGFLGGFTTFSAFSLEVVHLLRDGRVLPALGYISVSTAGGVAALFAVFLIVKRILA